MPDFSFGEPELLYLKTSDFNKPMQLDSTNNRFTLTIKKRGKMKKLFGLVTMGLLILSCNPMQAADDGTVVNKTVGACKSGDQICHTYCVTGFAANGKGYSDAEDCLVEKTADYTDGTGTREKTEQKLSQLIKLNRIPVNDVASAIRKSQNIQSLYQQLASKFPIANACKAANNQFAAAKMKFQDADQAFNCSSGTATGGSSGTVR